MNKFILMRIKILISLFASLFLFSFCSFEAGKRANRNKPRSQRITEPKTNHISEEKNSKRNISKNIKSEEKQNGLSEKSILSGEDIFERFNSAVFIIYTTDGTEYRQGSGFFITGNGIAVSNYHVFKGMTVGYESIKLYDGTTYKIEDVIAKNEEHDFIVFRVVSRKGNFNFIPITLSKPRIGEKVYAIGSPYGFENTFSSGEISQLRENNIIQISVPIDHGSSGGALINKYGEVVGITSGGLGKSGANINYAVDISIISRYIP